MLEQKIGQHAGEILDAEPEDGHRKRFAAKLVAQQQQQRRQSIRRTIRVCYAAAAAAVAALFMITLYDRTASGHDDESFETVYNYYAMRLDDEVEATRQHLRKLNEPERQEIWADIQRLRTENLPPFGRGEQNEALLVSVYSSKIQALQHIKQIIERYQPF